jgi:hypothetical protein
MRAVTPRSKAGPKRAVAGDPRAIRRIDFANGVHHEYRDADCIAWGREWVVQYTRHLGRTMTRDELLGAIGAFAASAARGVKAMS